MLTISLYHLLQVHFDPNSRILTVNTQVTTANPRTITVSPSQGILSTQAVEESTQAVEESPSLQASIFIVPRAANPNNDQSFVPQFMRMPIHSTVYWTNDDSIQHTVTSDEEGMFDSRPISPGETFDNTFDMPGEFGYHCAIHPWMTGRVMVD